MNTTLIRPLIRLLPVPLAVRMARFLATWTQRPPIFPAQSESLSRAVRISYGRQGRNVAWSWGKGPAVVLVHGWNGRAAQMAPLAEGIAALGYRCIAIDITGHGSSPGKRGSWSHFIDDIAAIAASLGEDIHAFIGHSAGGLAVMAARRQKGIRADRYVCICAPSHPFPPIDALRQRLDPPPAVLQGCREHIAREFGTSWEQLETGHAFYAAGSNLLVIADTGDRYVPHTAAERIHAWCAGSILTTLSGYGHVRILSAPEVVVSVRDFLGRDVGSVAQIAIGGRGAAAGCA